MTRIDLEGDLFQALCQFQALRQMENLRDYIEDGGRIRHVRDEIVTIDLPDDTFAVVNLRPVQHLLSALRRMDR